MTPKEFLDNVESTKNSLIKSHKKLIKDFEKDPSKVSRNDYPDFMFVRKSKEFNLYETSDILEMLSDAKSFLESIEQYKTYPGYYCSYEVEADSNYDVGYVRHNRIRASWYEPSEVKSSEEYEQYAKKSAKEIVKKALRPSNFKPSGFKDIDCKFMTLWIEGSIDWNTLQKIVYSDCTL